VNAERPSDIKTQAATSSTPYRFRMMNTPPIITGISLQDLKITCSLEEKEDKPTELVTLGSQSVQ
jgi:hypothetical protein